MTRRLRRDARRRPARGGPARRRRRPVAGARHRPPGGRARRARGVRLAPTATTPARRRCSPRRPAAGAGGPAREPGRPSPSPAATCRPRSRLLDEAERGRRGPRGRRCRTSRDARPRCCSRPGSTARRLRVADAGARGAASSCGVGAPGEECCCSPPRSPRRAGDPATAASAAARRRSSCSAGSAARGGRPAPSWSLLESRFAAGATARAPRRDTANSWPGRLARRGRRCAQRPPAGRPRRPVGRHRRALERLGGLRAAAHAGPTCGAGDRLAGAGACWRRLRGPAGRDARRVLRRGLDAVDDAPGARSAPPNSGRRPRRRAPSSLALALRAGRPQRGRRGLWSWSERWRATALVGAAGGRSGPSATHGPRGAPPRRARLEEPAPTAPGARPAARHERRRWRRPSVQALHSRATAPAPRPAALGELRGAPRRTRSWWSSPRSTVELYGVLLGGRRRPGCTSARRRGGPGGAHALFALRRQGPARASLDVAAIGAGSRPCSARSPRSSPRPPSCSCRPGG